MARGGRLKEEIVTEASSNSIDESEPEHQGVDASDRRARLRFQNRAGPAKLDKMFDKTGVFFFETGEWENLLNGPLLSTSPPPLPEKP